MAIDDTTAVSPSNPWGTQSNSIGSVVRDVLGVGQAAAVDLGTSFYNAIVPEEHEADTEVLLSKLSSNALAAYQESPDTVQALSFVAGSFVGPGVGLKVANALRGGLKGASFFNDAGAAVRLSKVDDLIKAGRMGTAEYRAATRSLYTQKIANNVLDSAAMELGFVGAMNAHPYMSDYELSDSFSMLPLAFAGGAAALAGIGARTAIRGAEHTAVKEAQSLISDALTPVAYSVDKSTQAIQRATNIKELEAMALNADLSPLTKNIVSHTLEQQKVRLINTFEGMASGDLAKLAKEERDALISKVADAKQGFAGVDKMHWATVDDIMPLPTPGAAAPKASKFTGILKSIEGKLVQKAASEAPTYKEFVYSAEAGGFYPKSQLKNLSVAADLGFTPKNLLDKVPTHFHMTPRGDRVLELLSETSAKTEADYLQAISHYSTLTPEQLAKAIIAPEDTASIQAAMIRMQKIAGESQAAGTPIPDMLVTIKDGSKKAEKVTYTQLNNMLLSSKFDTVQALVKQDLPIESIALRVNVPKDTAALMASGVADTKLLKLMKFEDSSEDALNAYLAQGKRSIVVAANKNRVPYAEAMASFGMKVHADIDTEIKSLIMALPASGKIANSLGSWLEDSSRAAELAILRKELASITNEGLGSKFLTSSDFALREYESTGYIISAFGKSVIQLQNQIVKDFLTPVTTRFASIAKNEAALTEMAILEHLHAGTAGERYFDKVTGHLMIIDKENPFTLVKGKKVPNFIPAKYQGVDFKVKLPETTQAIEAMQELGRHLYSMKNANNKLLGAPAIKDMGFWMPPLNLINKHRVYVVDTDNNTTRLLWGYTKEDAQSAVDAYKATLSADDLGRSRYDFVDASRLEDFNKIAGRHDPLTMSTADISMFHKGSSQSPIVKVNTNMLTEMVSGYEGYIRDGVRKSLDINMSDIMEQLDVLSAQAQQGVKGQALSYIRKVVNVPKDAGAVVKNTLLGRSDLNQYVGWRDAQASMEGLAESALDKVLKIAPKLTGANKTDDYAAYAKSLEQAGVQNPFSVFDEVIVRSVYGAQKLEHVPHYTPRLLALGNTFLATSMLKFMEVAHGYVNAISMPILLSSAISTRKAQRFFGVEATNAGQGVLDIARTMHGGVRYGSTDEGIALLKKATEEGVLDRQISEMNEHMMNIRSVDPSLLTKAENFLTDKKGFIEKASFASNWSEDMVRRNAFLAGAYHAKVLYPGISQEGQYVFARHIMDQALGNYSVAQRPIMFQGTLGSAMGLFQTYMVTYAQQMYRHLELGERKALAKMMLAQAGIFGAASLPGFNFVSEQIGEHFSDNHFDLQTGLFRALPEGAEWILYGLPSNLGPAINTRGDISPRIPNIAGGLDNLPMVNAVKSMAQATGHLLNAAKSTGDVSTVQAFSEALSLQTLSRPIARISEIASGYSLTQSGDIMQGPEEVRSFTGIAARLLNTRPIAEMKAREAVRLNRMYGQLDSEERSNVLFELKRGIRDGDLSSEAMDKLASEYLKSGSPQGWRSAVNRAIAQTEEPSDDRVLNYLGPDSPTARMIDDLDGE